MPRLPLIHVVGAQEISALAGHNVQRGLVEIGQICGESFGRTVASAYCLHRVSAAGLLLHARSGPAADHRNLSKDRMLDLDRVERTPAPGGEISPLVTIVPRSIYSRGQQFVIV